MKRIYIVALATLLFSNQVFAACDGRARVQSMSWKHFLGLGAFVAATTLSGSALGLVGIFAGPKILNSREQKAREWSSNYRSMLDAGHSDQFIEHGNWEPPYMAQLRHMRDSIIANLDITPEELTTLKLAAVIYKLDTENKLCPHRKYVSQKELLRRLTAEFVAMGVPIKTGREDDLRRKIRKIQEKMDHESLMASNTGNEQ